jgi:uncharacterized protein YhaN
MRIDRLDLLRYGKFTDRSIDFPVAERDFHVIVGPNEAGKSTVRNAIHDLLYAIPGNTSHAFLHQMPELRVGAKLEHDGNTLEFRRSKGNKQTLRDADDKPLTDGALGPYLGTTDKAFFSQMFGLDHARLVEGGHGILSASNDLGQILFQSAAGIGNLGLIRQALESEADKLWSKRRSGDRAYYVASDQLDEATSALKQATVRMKVWSDAHGQVAELEQAQAALKAAHADVRKRRNLLERIRRVLPHLQALDAAHAVLRAPGTQVELPLTAAKTFSDAERALAAAQADIGHQSALLAEARTALEGVSADTGILAFAKEIEALNEQRFQYRAYAADIERRQAEIDAQWQLAAGLAAGVGWDAVTEEALRDRLPRPAVRALLTRLVAFHDSLRQAVEAAGRTERSKRSEIELATERLAALPASAMPTSLQAALTQAQRQGDIEAILRERRQAVRKLEGDLAQACAALGKWRRAPDELSSMAVPEPDFIKSLILQQAGGDAEVKARADRAAVLEQQVGQARLDVAQYRQAHDTVTRDELLEARDARDKTWRTVRADASLLSARGDDFERQVVAADTLADRRQDTAQEASELLSRQAQVERVERELESVRAELRALEAASAARVSSWQALAATCGLPDLPFQAATPWLGARDRALQAGRDLDEARLAQQTVETGRDEARTMLACELAKAGRDVGTEPLEVLMLLAGEHVGAISDARGQRRTLDKQIEDARQALALLVEDGAKAGAAFEAWKGGWADALAQAGLHPDADLPFVQGLLDAAAKIEAALDDMAKKRVERVDSMRADLQAHDDAAQALARRTAADLLGRTSFDVALELLARLKVAGEGALARERHRTAIDVAQKRHDEAVLKREQAQASLTPLWQRAGVASNDELEAAIAASDSRRAVQATIAACEQAIREGSDGLTLAQVRAELALVDVPALLDELAELTQQDETFVGRLSDLAAGHQAANSALLAIGGSSDAAIAEGRRQEALSKMTEAVERYVKVHTAARLLKWSIEQYREAKQGPMLTLASDIFRRLTSGSFDKLTVDFDSKPLKLLGRRPNGAFVEIDGMSEGTRDQLYLALRLAALDMHLGQAHVLPFIADDLFINYDDGRAKAGLEALGELSRKTQVLFLTHHDHLLPAVHAVFGDRVNVVTL